MRDDELIGKFIDERCPQCGSTLLANKRGDKWCSNVGGITVSGCTYGLLGIVGHAYAERTAYRLVKGESRGSLIGLINALPQ